MLAPETRRILMEALKPPPGFRFDLAVATTYSLDLMALLTAPLAFSMFDADAARTRGDGDAAESTNPFALLQAVRSYAARTTVFCQAAQIVPPARYQRVLTYLEDSVVEVNPPSASGVFHPKLWALRMVGEDDEVLYRLLCLSRNLTFDRSWDTMLVLEGPLTDRKNRYSENVPLEAFFRALPDLAVRRPSQRILDQVEQLAYELARVDFELPEPFEGLAFHPTGIPGYSRLQLPQTKRALIVSPFVTQGALEELATGGTLVSRAEELEQLPREALEGFEVHVLQDGAELLDQGEDAAPFEGRGAGEFRPPPIGLHAKLFVQDEGWNAHVWTGSTNATSAALHQNVEFLVQLTGKKSRVGIDAMLEGTREVPGLRPLLAPWTPPESAVEGDAIQQALEERLRMARRALARMRWTAPVREAPEGYGLRLEADAAAEVPEGVTLAAWPVSLSRDTYSTPLVREGERLKADFGARSFEALTSFFAISVSAVEGTQSCEEVFVVNAELLNAPADRAARVLESMLDDPAKVLRFLRLLLALEPLELMRALMRLDSDGEGADGSDAERAPVPLLEAMLRALDLDPTRLDDIDSVVTDLLRTEQGRAFLPPDFMKAWEPIREARKRLKGAAA